MTFIEQLKYKYCIRKVFLSNTGINESNYGVERFNPLMSSKLLNGELERKQFNNPLNKWFSSFLSQKQQRKRKIAFITLLNPLSSGISDWAEELLPYLNEFFDIDIYIPFSPSMVSNIAIKKAFKIYEIKKFYKKYKEYDYSIYQAGNHLNHKLILDCFIMHGGILELHDLALHHYFERVMLQSNPEKYIDILRYCHGEAAALKAKRFLREKRHGLWEEGLKYNVIKCYVDRADSIIVHSDFAKQIVKGIAPNKTVYMIPLPCGEISSTPELDYYSSRKTLGINDEIVMSTFGLITPEKRIIPILKQISKIKSIINRKFIFFIVGEVHIPRLQEIIEELQIKEYVCVTGKVPLDSFKLYIQASDLCFNLRYPTMGESSAALLRLIGYGKTVVVTDIGSFHDFEEEHIYKVDYGKQEEEDILQIMIHFLKSFKGYSKKKVENIISYAKENYDLAIIAREYYEYLQMKKNANTYADMLLDNIMIYHPYEQVIMDRIITNEKNKKYDDFKKYIHPFEITEYDYFHVELGTALSFCGDQSTSGDKYLISGFSQAEPTHTWTDGKKAEMCFVFDNIEEDLEFSLDYVTFDGKQPVKISANNQMILEYVANGAENKSFVIPKEVIGMDKRLILKFDFSGARSPAALEQGDDTRELALAMKSMVIKSKKE